MLWGALTPQEAGQLVGCLGWASTASHVVLWELKPQPLVQQIQLIPKGRMSPQASSITHYTAGSLKVPSPDVCWKVPKQFGKAMPQAVGL